MWTALILVDTVTALVAAAVFITLSGRRPLSRRHRKHTVELGPYDAAFLAGGAARVVETALHILWGADGNVVIGSGGRLRLPAPWSEPGHPVEQAVVEKWRTSGSTTPTLLRVRAVRAGAVGEIGDRLVGHGLLMSPARARARRYAARGLVAVVCGTAALSAFAATHGPWRAAPFVAVGVCCLAVRVLFTVQGSLTPAGRRHLRAVRTGELWASGPLGAVVFDGRSGLPGEHRRSRRWGRGGSPLPSGRMLITYGKALDPDSDGQDPGGDSTGTAHGSDGFGGSHDTSYDGGGHHSCGGGGGNY